ncbi:MAG TPA: hypothetical protein VJX16_29205 [Terriglobales bacterium]|nr:hypothetical protein [Terriglobales bacterium]
MHTEQTIGTAEKQARTPAILDSALGRLNEALAKGLGRWIVALVLFSVAAVVQTWPLVLHASTSIIDTPEQQGDTGYYLWNLWWIKHALVDLHTNPFHAGVVFSPQGTDLYLGGVVLVSGLLFIPINLVSGNFILSVNVLSLVLFVLSGLTMYALSFRITRNHAAALVAGFIFAFAPFTVIHSQGGEWNHSATFLLPLFPLFLLRFMESFRLREAVAAGVTLALIIYNWLEYGTDAALFAAIFVLYWSVIFLRRDDWPNLRALWRGFGVVSLVSFVLSSPLIFQAFRTLYSGDISARGGAEFYSADLLTYITPSPLWGPGNVPGDPYGTHLPIGAIENTAYLGIVPLILAGFSLLTIRRTPHSVAFWGIVLLTFATLALGPYLYVGGSKTASLFGLSFSVPMPYQLYDKLPVFGSRRFTARMIVFGMIGLSVLAAVGLDSLMSWLRTRADRPLGRAAVAVAASLSVAAASCIAASEYGAESDWVVVVGVATALVVGAAICLTRLAPQMWHVGSAGGALAGLVAVLVLGLVVFDYWNPPAQVSEVRQPEILKKIADEPGDFVVLDAPLGRQDGYTAAGDSNGGWLATYYEWMHGKRTVGGYVPRSDDLKWIMDTPGFHYLACRCSDYPYPGYRTPDVSAVLRNFGVKYVLLHKRGPNGQGLLFIGDAELAIYDAYLRGMLNFEPVYSDDILAVYKNRDPSVGSVKPD